ncbi:hypothetical protein Q5P01_014341 [Channa striata]|uniref:Uncharacterized protein n=1 Tax=Channa striata TaxID=64152 RepID=A0AA88SMS2_CHASR|nr:hypothetical protein Q5P01_014341 [Channa striata]
MCLLHQQSNHSWKPCIFCHNCIWQYPTVITTKCVSPALELCLFQCAATGPTNLPNVLLLLSLLCSFLSLNFLLTPTGQGRWPPTLSLVLLDVSSVKGSFSSPLLPMGCSRGICWVFSKCLYSLGFIM